VLLEVLRVRRRQLRLAVDDQQVLRIALLGLAGEVERACGRRLPQDGVGVAA
jgi:hypothetical protein